MDLNHSFLHAERRQRGLPAGGRLLRALVAAAGLLCATAMSVFAQNRPLIVNLGPLDGVELSPDNIFSYSIQSPLAATTEAVIRGKVTYRASGLSFSYSYRYLLRPGVNTIDGTRVHAQWTWSSPGLKELFQDYRKLPQGTYEYCVGVSPVGQGGEVLDGGQGNECIYQKVDDVFLISLVDPENDAKIYERYPVLSWMVNYPFASALSYRIRVAEVKEGQNNTAAVNRNNPVYQESNLRGLSVAYPVYGKPLEAFRPYAWTVDAYYKGILLGGAKPFRFTIIHDSTLKGVPHESYYVDIRQENNSTAYYAVGKIKLKYILDETLEDNLSITLTDKNGKEIKIKEKELKAKLGDNRYEINLKEQVALKHLGTYELKVVNGLKQEYRLSVKYVNPDFLN